MTGFLRANARWLGAGALLAFASTFGQTVFIAVFAAEIQREFALSHGSWGAIYALGTLASAVAMVLIGGLSDLYRVRVLAPWVLAGLAVACTAMAVNPVVWLLPVVIFALRLTGQGMTSHVARVAMARWFVGNRGKALSISSLGFSVGEALLPLLFTALLVAIHWRGLWVVAALLALLAIPILRQLLKEERTPQSFAANADSAGLGGRHWTRRELLRSPWFWGLLPALSAPPALITAFFFHQVHLADAIGLPHLHLVALFPLYSGLAILAMLGSGWVVDKVGTARPIILYQIPLALGFCVIWVSQDLGMLALGVALLALSAGANNTIPAAFWAEGFGTRHLGAIKSVAAAVMVVGSALGPLATGLAIDQGMPFPEQMPLISLYILMASLGMGLCLAQLRKVSAVPL